MKRDVLVAVLAGVLAVLGPWYSHSVIAADEKSELQALLAENKNLTLQLDKAEKVKGEIAKAELSISGAQSALKSFKQQLQRSGAGLLEEANSIDTAAQRAGCPWGTTSTDKPFVDSCNAEGERLQSLLQDVRKKAMTLEQYGQKLEEDQTALSNKTVSLFKKKKANNADREDLYAARTDFLRRYQAFVVHSETYERLKTMDPIARFCKGLSLASATECLTRLWDGSR